MRNRQYLIFLLLIIIILFSACGKTTGTSEESAAATADSSQEDTADAPEADAGETVSVIIPDEPYEAVEYNLYPSPEGGYVGDVMPYVADGGVLELYYLYDTDHNGQSYHPIYKYSTEDLSGFEDHGIVLNFGLMSEPDPALGTGSVMQDPSGLYHLFYTGHNDTGNGGKGKECVLHATSTDRENWVKDERVLFFAPEGYSKDDFRDPEVFWVEKDQCYWLLIAANENTLGGVVLKYTSRDLRNWEFIGPIYAPLKQYMCECPDLFRIGDYWYITYSWDCVTYYAMSDSIDGPFVAPRDNILDGKGTTEGAGFVFYAGKTAEIDDNIYLCGWLGRAGLTSDSGVYQWAGNVMIHQLVQHEDGTLGVEAPELYDSYFTGEKPFQAAGIEGSVEIKGSSIALSAEPGSYALAEMGTRPATMMLECDVRLDEDGLAGFAFGGSDKDKAYTALCLDARQNVLHYEGCEIEDLETTEPAAFTKFNFNLADTHHVKLVCENEIVVMYVDGVKALSCRISHSIDGAHIGVFSYGCSADFDNISMKLPE